MRHLLHRVLLGAVLSVSLYSALQALPIRAFERATAFSICAGRLEALALYHRNHSRLDTTEVTAMAQAFSDMVEAVLPFALEEGVPPNEPIKLRASGWTETVALLNERDHSFDTARAERAANRLQGAILSCTRLIAPRADPGWVQSLTHPTY